MGAASPSVVARAAEWVLEGSVVRTGSLEMAQEIQGAVAIHGKAAFAEYSPADQAWRVWLIAEEEKGDA